MQNFIDIIHPEDQESVKTAWLAAMKGIGLKCQDIVHAGLMVKNVRTSFTLASDYG
jgi:hypothetical protein